jgi:PAS domain S-box-containing protein
VQEKAVLRIGEDGVILSATGEAETLFGGELAGAPLSSVLDRTNGRGEWTSADGRRFEADSFGVRRDGQPLEIRLELPRTADDSHARRRRDSLLRITAEVARAENADLDDVVVEALGRIGHLTRVDRASVVVMTDDQHARTTHEWAGAGTAPYIDLLQDVPRQKLRWFEERLQKDGHLVLQSRQDIPEGGPEANAILEEMGSRSLLLVGMLEEKNLLGLVGFDAVSEETAWSKASVEQLRWVAELIIDALLRARTRKELERSKEFSDLVSLATNDIIWDLDLETGLASHSDAIESVLGFPPQTDQDGDWWLNRIHPDDVDSCRSRIAETFEDPANSFLELSYRIRHRDGSWVHLLDRGYVVRDEEGRAIRSIGTSTDLTERMRESRQREESEARFRAVVENISDVIGIVDRTGTIIYQSPASEVVFGYPPDEEVGQSAFAHVHPEDRERVEHLFHKAIETNLARARATFRYRHAAGHWLTVETVGANVLDSEKIGGIVLVSRDVTMRRQLEQQLERTTRLASLGHLASSVAHEFNNVLMGAQPFVEIVRRTASDDRALAATARIAEALEKGKAVSHGLLQLARPVAVALETFDLCAWLLSTEDEMRRMAPRDDITIELALPEQPLSTTADPAGLRHALLNLILNASDVLENRADGKIEISVRRATSKDRESGAISGDPEDYVVLIVTDNGPGIESSDLGHLFEPMFRTGRASRGGLGVHVVQQLIAAQGGDVGVESTSEGTSFLLFLRSGREIASAPLELRPPEIGRSITETILLVEDNELVSSGIAAILELEDQQVTVARTGAEAIEWLARERPSVLILDIGLPDMSGTDVYDRISDRHPDLPVIFSSGHGDQRALRKYLDRPNVEFLLKPYDAATLMSIVERLTVSA